MKVYSFHTPPATSGRVVGINHPVRLYYVLQTAERNSASLRALEPPSSGGELWIASLCSQRQGGNLNHPFVPSSLEGNFHTPQPPLVEGSLRGWILCICTSAAINQLADINHVYLSFLRPAAVFVAASFFTLYYSQNMIIRFFVKRKIDKSYNLFRTNLYVFDIWLVRSGKKFENL